MLGRTGTGVLSLVGALTCSLTLAHARLLLGLVQTDLAQLRGRPARRHRSVEAQHVLTLCRGYLTSEFRFKFGPPTLRIRSYVGESLTSLRECPDGLESVLLQAFRPLKCFINSQRFCHAASVGVGSVRSQLRA